VPVRAYLRDAEKIPPYGVTTNKACVFVAAARTAIWEKTYD
jgi:hypothetical protein